MRGHRFLPLAFPLGSLLLLACSSADFQVSNGPGDDSGAVLDSSAGGDSAATDSGAGGDGRPDAISGDTGTGSEGGSDGISSDGTTGCGALGTGDHNVYVDNASAADSVGTLACPFHTIYEATSLSWIPASGHRTIHVAAGTYAESHQNIVSNGVFLEGKGVGITQVSGGGTCTGGVFCTFEIAPGGVLHDLTVNASATGHGIVMDAPGTLTQPLVHHVAANGAGSGMAGIFTRGAADIGPNVALTGNGRGLDSVGTGIVHVIGAATPSPTDNVFSGSMQSGITMEGSAMLLFDAGEVHHNSTNGISFVGGGGVHTIRMGSFHDNTEDGIALTSDCSLYVRDSVFENNAFGIRFAKTSSNSINLGDGSSGGGNVFGTTSVSLRNRIAGVCLNLGSFSTYTVNARDDEWSACDPTLLHVSSCDGATVSTYYDIYLAPSSGATPDSSGCAPGP